MKLLPLLLALCVVLPAAAQTQQRRAQVYRCGPDGRDLRDSPCPGGSGAAANVSYDEPSAADSKAARDRHLTDAKHAAALAASRRASEAEARRMRSQHVGLQTLPAPVAAPSSPQVVVLKPPQTAKPRKPGSAASSAR